MNDSSTVHCCVSDGLSGKSRFRTKAASEVLIRICIGIVLSVVKEYDIWLTVILVPPCNNKADYLTHASHCWLEVPDACPLAMHPVLHRLKSTAPNVKVELYLNTDPIDPVEDKKIIAQMPLRDKMVLTAKLVQVGSNMPSSPDSSSDSSTGSPQHPYEGPNVEAENCLPGVVSIILKV
ncbi:putative ubiquitin carboxyl-terminal hydrolase FAF-Y [Portunus trituberculatus]|uniref:Putative ubiquitin carboxyl-terminal hydrolase FAF-Y n=1 Tax=Portunus trituberculatus TaxID=210409 RepID=A0A5B7FVR4_PORTR|nr:putative ubiquitin carboxyl-terminal hydrolase FAF-Y [Portunus trituberculatus]